MVKWLCFGIAITAVLWLSTKIIDAVFAPDSRDKN